MFKYLFFILGFISFLYPANIEVKKHKYFANGFNIIVDAKIKDVVEARVFFKDNNSPKYQLYIKMKCEGDSCYGKLPLTKGELLAMDFIVASKSSSGELERSAKYTVTKRDLLILPSWQNKYYEESFELYSEFKPSPTYIRGIADHPKVKTTVDEDIWGIKLNLYDAVKENNDCECKDSSDVDIDVDKSSFSL